MAGATQQHPAEVMGYEEAKNIAGGADTAARCGLAGRPDIQPEILFFLAGDPDRDVRAAIAGNPATPLQASPVLARDEDEAVRCTLAERVGKLLPGLSGDDRARAQEAISETLTLLVQDQVPKVRAIFAETLKHADGVPAHIVETLARDTEISVAAPVLEFSPLLDDAFLIELINTKPATGSLCAISRRTAVAEPVCDAMVDAGDAEAITALLQNDSAQIREETLDFLADQAASVPEWQAPLVDRPSLPDAAASRLAEYVAEDLLDRLVARTDISSETAQALSEMVKSRLATGGDPAGEAPSEAQILEDLSRGNRDAVVAALADAADVDIAIIEKAVSFASAKGIVAIAWRAGLGMGAAERLQLDLARVPPPKLVEADEEGGFPLTEDEMSWLLEFFGKER